MRVYRIISAREITNMYKNNPERRAVVAGENAHQYEIDTTYIHFFRYWQSAEYFFKRCRVAMNRLDEYIAYMTANIPNELLRKRIEYGFYNIDEEPFEYDTIPISEYTIKQEEMKPEYIIEINNFIKSEYKNPKEEYEKYLAFMLKLKEQYDGNFYAIAKYLKNNNLEQLLEVKDDDRTEPEIFHDKLKQLSKVFPIYD